METKTVVTGFAIVVLDNGFVYVGDVEYGDIFCVVKNTRNIRRWGTTEGLGELALKGPRENTILDDVGTIRVPVHAANHLIDTEAQLWKS